MQTIITTTLEKGDNAQVLLSLEELIKTNVSSIDRQKVELKKLRDMLKDACANDSVYHQHDEVVKEAQKVRAATKAQIMKQPANVELDNKIKSLRSEIKEKQLSLSDYLLEYQRMTGVTQLELFPGEILEIVQTAKVIRTRKVKN